MMAQAIGIAFRVVWALILLVAHIIDVALSIIGWMIGALGIITRLAVIVLLIILIALLLHFFGGVKFADADLIGIPIRLVVSEKTGELVEWKERGGEKAEVIEVEEIIGLKYKYMIKQNQCNNQWILPECIYR